MKISVGKTKEQGQILVFAIVILIILLIATLFLFDLHSIIRSKIKLDTAEQSAALAAANWQKRSLNLIGDINLAKAATTLLDDVPTEGETETEKISSANKTLTEMQSRISFCGPLIAFGAAQQAAKNNGINIYESDAQSSYKTVKADFDNYLAQLDPSSQYYNYGDIAEYVHYYKWRDPYVAMLRLIASQGLAVRPNGYFPGLESVDPPWLDDSTLYRAIINQAWCNRNLNAIVKYPDSYWNGKWWNVDFEHTSFPNESEIYTLGLRFAGSTDQSALEKALNETLDSARLHNLAPISWCVYDSKWTRYNADGITQNINYSGPNNDGYNYWSRGMFLRDNLKSNVFYGGAVAYAECYQRIKLMNKYKTRMTRPASADDTAGDADQMLKAKYAVKNNIIRQTSGRTLKVGDDSTTDSDAGGAVAKPLGAFSNGAPPTDAILVLPVFTNVSLIPSSMQKCRPLRINFSDVERFLVWLSTVDDLHNPPTAPPPGTEQYLVALQKLDDPTFRKTGWNNDYVSTTLSTTAYFSDNYKYSSETNPSGAGWLQQIWVGTDNTADEESTEIKEQEAGWNTRIYLGKRYILKDRNGNLVTNEQMVCRWEPGGPVPGPGPGTRTGPPHL